MNKRNIKYFIFLAVGFIGLFLAEYYTPKPINWNLSYSEKDKIPYGCYILHDLLEEVFPEKEISENKNSIYEELYAKNDENQNFIFISDYFDVDSLDALELIRLAQDGNNIFISAISFSDYLMDTLNFTIEYDMDLNIIIRKDSGQSMNFVNQNIKTNSGYFYEKSSDAYFINEIDTQNTIILGVNREGDPNFIKILFGEGHFFIHTQPFVFTNYYMLDEANITYVYKALSYLPVNDLVWDEYYKPNRKVVHTPIRYILSTPPLKAAYTLLMIGILLQIFFTAKRKQRIIPVIKPPSNTSLEFIETIGRLYFHEKDHTDIANKKFNFLLEFIRSRYYMKNIDFQENTIDLVAQKSGFQPSTIKNIFLQGKKIRAGKNISDKELLIFNNSIERFYRKCK